MDIDPLYIVAGVVVGFVVGLTGMGGGALMTPVLVLLYGVDPLSAVSSDLVVSMVMKPVGGTVHLRRGTANLALAKWLLIGSVPSAFGAVLLLQWMQDRGQDVDAQIKVFIGAALLLASAGLVVKGAFSAQRRETDDDVRIRVAPTLAIGVFGGLMVGLTSVGSGSLIMVLLMFLYPKMPSNQLVGTDLVQAVPLVASAAIAHLLFGEVDFDIAGALLIGALPAVYLGARVSSEAADHLIRPILPIVLVVSSLKLLKAPNLWVGLAMATMVGILVLLRVRHSRTLAEIELEPAVGGD